MVQKESHVVFLCNFGLVLFVTKHSSQSYKDKFHPGRSQQQRQRVSVAFEAGSGVIQILIDECAAILPQEQLESLAIAGAYTG